MLSKKAPTSTCTPPCVLSLQCQSAPLGKVAVFCKPCNKLTPPLFRKEQQSRLQSLHCRSPIPSQMYRRYACRLSVERSEVSLVN